MTRPELPQSHPKTGVQDDHDIWRELSAERQGKKPWKAPKLMHLGIGHDDMEDED